jgi:hypothetical protein
LPLLLEPEGLAGDQFLLITAGHAQAGEGSGSRGRVEDPALVEPQLPVQLARRRRSTRAARQLVAILGKLSGRSQRRGKLAVVKSMTEGA